MHNRSLLLYLTLQKISFHIKCGFVFAAFHGHDFRASRHGSKATVCAQVLGHYAIYNRITAHFCYISVISDTSHIDYYRSDIVYNPIANTYMLLSGFLDVCTHLLTSGLPDLLL